jgi:hypothetical protein
MTLPGRFWAKVDKNGPIPSARPELGPCWLWTAFINTDGYGKFRWQGEMRLAHRVAYEQLFGPVPDGLELDHLCRNHACCNPTHLEPVTHGENVRRGTSPLAINAAKTHCPAGHAYDTANTHVAANRQRHCRTCRRDRERARYARRKAA